MDCDMDDLEESDRSEDGDQPTPSPLMTVVNFDLLSGSWQYG